MSNSTITAKHVTKPHDGPLNGFTIYEECHTTYAEDGCPLDVWKLHTTGLKGTYTGKAAELEIAYAELIEKVQDNE